MQATADETMLVRRGGTLQWVPLLTTVLLISGEYVLEGDYLANEPVTLYTGTLV